MSYKVLITDYYYPTLNEEKKVFTDTGIDIVDGKGICNNEDDVIYYGKDADALIIQFVPITRRIIENLPKCKIIVRYAIGLDIVDIQAATEKKIMVANVPDYCIDEVADHALTLMLAVIRKLKIATREVADGHWSYKRTVPIQRLSEMSLGLVSFGNIARNFAHKAKALGFKKIRVFDPYITNNHNYRDYDFVSLHTLLQESDVISIHAPSTAETKHMINRNALAMMKEGAYLINTSRGALIDEKALLETLESGKLGGVGLDVLEDEKSIGDNPILKFENVVITPHMSWYSIGSISELQRKVAEQVKQALLQGQPSNWCNKF
jgi:D-3-phosphoglycerate dehydrogenase / 2-oxoglutarate reductase